MDVSTQPFLTAPFDGQAWALASTDIVRGLNHALGNRLAPFDMLASPAMLGQVLDHELYDVIAKETERLSVLLKLYRLMEYPLSTAVEPVRISDVLADAIQLQQHHGGVRTVPCTTAGETAVDPVLTHPTRLAQALAFALCAVARAAFPAGNAAAMTVRCSSDAETVTVRVSTTVGSDTGAGDPERRVAEALLERDGGTVQWDATATQSTMQLTLPTLRRARRTDA